MIGGSFFRKNELRDRWQHEDERVKAIISAIKAEQDWTKYLISDYSHNFGALPLVNDGCISKNMEDIGPRDLRGLFLEGENLSESSKLSDASFDFAILSNCNFCSSILTGTSFSHTALTDVDFESCSLQNSNFSESQLTRINFTDAILHDTSFRNSLLDSIIFMNSDLNGVTYNSEPTLGRLGRLFKDKRATHIRNFKHEIEKENFVEISFELLNYLKDQLRIDMLNRSAKVFSFFYSLFTDYGRNFNRLAIWIILSWIFFGFLYSGSSLLIIPKISWDDSYKNWYDPYFFSIITSFGINYGDTKPTGVIAEILISIQLVLSFIFFGMFITMLFSYVGKSK